MKRFLSCIIAVLFFASFQIHQTPTAWIRINQLGYQPKGIKIAVWCSKENTIIQSFQLIDATSNKIVFTGNAGKTFGAYGPFTQTYRLNFSSFTKPGKYYLQADETRSPEFRIGDDVYKGSADFCLRYMRQQRCGFNSFLKDSCHTHDGYVLYGEKAGIKDSTYVDLVGGWHDASDYLKYSATSANATYHLLMAYRDFKNVFTDEKLANGLNGKNGIADVLDEAKWGLDWLLKMHPSENIMFNQVGDDRDHQGMRIPKEDSFYGRGYERPAYFISGEPQQRGKFMNNTTGTSSTAAKFASVFALVEYFCETDSLFRKSTERKDYYDKAFSALHYAEKKLGVTQTVSVKSPYIYAEENWIDDMELAYANIHKMVVNADWGGDGGYYLILAEENAEKEKITPWLGSDTANHYQWYPFINLGHYEIARQVIDYPKDSARLLKHFKDDRRQKIFAAKDNVLNWYKEGISRVWNKAKQNAFYRGIPFIWCSNNLTTSFAIQCYWYRQLTNDKTFLELEQANFDWLFGCNPWGTSFVYGLPANGDFPSNPHSAFTHLKNYPIDGGLVDGPVYGSIYKNLIGIKLYQPDEYADLQSDLAVYHDDYGDYSTNEPTMDGTASLIYLLAAKESAPQAHLSSRIEVGGEVYDHGGIVRGDSTKKQIALVFTGDKFADGGNFIAKTLEQEKINASFFFTGRFYENPSFKKIILQLKKKSHYLGAHSFRHLLYCDWNNRDSLLVNKKEFEQDLLENYSAMEKKGIHKKKAKYFLPPFEWYNDSISEWTKQLGLQLINYTPGTLSHADYTMPADKNYRDSKTIYTSIINYEKSRGLNGFILLMHIGTDPKRTDKFYYHLPSLLNYLKQKGYRFVTVDQLLEK